MAMDARANLVHCPRPPRETRGRCAYDSRRYITVVGAMWQNTGGNPELDKYPIQGVGGGVGVGVGVGVGWVTKFLATT